MLSINMTIFRIMTFLLTYLLILLAVFFLQRKIIYFPTRFSPAQQAILLKDLQLQRWPSATDYRGVMSATPVPNAKGTVLVFHGNAGAALQRNYFIDALQPLGYRVIVAEYPGYGSRSGSPSEAVLIEDGIASAQQVLRDFDEPLFLCGESLGTGVVAGIIASKSVPVRGALLITPFDSLSQVAHHHYWFFLARWLIRDSYDNLTRLADYTGPVAVLLAGQDEVIPTARTLALFDALPAQKRLWRFDQAGHNSLPLESWQPWWQAAMSFIDQGTL